MSPEHYSFYDDEPMPPDPGMDPGMGMAPSGPPPIDPDDPALHDCLHWLQQAATVLGEVMGSGGMQYDDEDYSTPFPDRNDGDPFKPVSGTGGGYYPGEMSDWSRQQNRGWVYDPNDYLPWKDKWTSGDNYSQYADPFGPASPHDPGQEEIRRANQQANMVDDPTGEKRRAEAWRRAEGDPFKPSNAYGLDEGGEFGPSSGEHMDQWGTHHAPYAPIGPDEDPDWFYPEHSTVEHGGFAQSHMPGMAPSSITGTRSGQGHFWTGGPDDQIHGSPHPSYPDEPRRPAGFYDYAAYATIGPNAFTSPGEIQRRRMGIPDDVFGGIPTSRTKIHQGLNPAAKVRGTPRRSGTLTDEQKDRIGRAMMDSIGRGFQYADETPACYTDEFGRSYPPQMPGGAGSGKFPSLEGLSPRERLEQSVGEHPWSYADDQGPDYEQREEQWMRDMDAPEDQRPDHDFEQREEQWMRDMDEQGPDNYCNYGCDGMLEQLAAIGHALQYGEMDYDFEHAPGSPDRDSGVTGYDDDELDRLRSEDANARELNRLRSEDMDARELNRLRSEDAEARRRNPPSGYADDEYDASQRRMDQTVRRAVGGYEQQEQRRMNEHRRQRALAERARAKPRPAADPNNSGYGHGG